MNTDSTRQEKHISLQEAIQHINSINDHLDDLINKVQGPVPQTEAAVEPSIKEVTSLAEVLDRGATTIKDYVEPAHKRIEVLQELLF